MCFAAAKRGLRHSTQSIHETLHVVAFSDPNDLLSFAIPSWYARSAEEFRMRITNVTVDVATHWFGLFEWPRAAHDDYFASDEVWELIRCGAASGQLTCRAAGH